MGSENRFAGHRQDPLRAQRRQALGPASNVKLYTVALALDRLGPDYRIRTSLYAKTGPEPGGALQGDLIVYGRGDPTINARLHGGDVLKALEPLAAALANAGVKRIVGRPGRRHQFLSRPGIWLRLGLGRPGARLRRGDFIADDQQQHSPGSWPGRASASGRLAGSRSCPQPGISP